MGITAVDVGHPCHPGQARALAHDLPSVAHRLRGPKVRGCPSAVSVRFPAGVAQGLKPGHEGSLPSPVDERG